MPVMTTLVDNTVPVAADFNGNFTALNNAIGSGTAITTYTTGDMLYASAANTLSKLVAGASRQTLTIASGIPAWTSDIVTLDRDVTLATVNNDAAETTVYTFSVPGNTFGTTRAIRITAYGDYLNTVAPSNLTVRCKYGGSSYFDSGAISVTNDANRRAWLLESMLSTAGATNSELGFARLVIGNANTAGGNGSTTIFATDFANNVAGGLSIDSTVAQTLAITLQHGTADANITVRCAIVQVELL